jgi:hypothetical protein
MQGSGFIAETASVSVAIFTIYGFGGWTTVTDILYVFIRNIMDNTESLPDMASLRLTDPRTDTHTNTHIDTHINARNDDLPRVTVETVGTSVYVTIRVTRFSFDARRSTLSQWIKGRDGLRRNGCALISLDDSSSCDLIVTHDSVTFGGSNERADIRIYYPTETIIRWLDQTINVITLMAEKYSNVK